MRTVASETGTPADRDQSRLGQRAAITRKSRLRRTALEALEPRTLMAVLPAATPTYPTLAAIAAGDISQTKGNESSPSVTLDRANSQKLVAVWVSNDPTRGGTTKVTVEGAYSNNAGATWSKFNAAPSVFTDPLSDPKNLQPFAQVTDPSVGFDANGNFYVLVDEHNVGSGSGALVLNKFNFNGSAPVADATVKNKLLDEWTTDPIFTPTLAVDDNLASFTDPTQINQTQTDKLTGNVYVAWSTNNVAPTNTDTGSFNPNTIQMIVSADGGKTFTNPQILGGGNFSGSERDAAPQIAISQGRLSDTVGYLAPDPGVSGGQATVVWDNFGSGAQATPPTDTITSGAVQDGGTADVFNGAGGPIADATDAGNSNSNPVATKFTTNVAINDPKFTTLSSLTVTVNLQSKDLTELSLELVPPSGTGVGPITLVANQQNAQGKVPSTAVGIAGANLGTTPSGINIGTTFDDSAARTINNQGGVAPFAGRFQPEDPAGLAVLKGLDPTKLNGIWTLRITDFHFDGANPPPNTLLNFSLNFSSGVTPQPTSTVATTFVHGALTAPFPLTAPVSPVQGIGPAPVIASDNTLGSFSPHEGRLYVAYVGHYNQKGNPADNTDIFLSTSDDGGVTWQNAGQVNNDNATTDGYSEASGQTAGRPQFMPAVAVDPVTGTVVATFRDARDDAARARVVTTVATSIDGGATFGPQVYANPQQQATDAITGNTVVLGPYPDNQSAGNPNSDAVFGFGTKMGLAVFGGHAYPVWSGNLNQGTAAKPVLLDIYTNPMTFAAGPRVVSSTMGPVGQFGDTVNTQTGPDGTPIANAFEVILDRPVDPAVDPLKTFTKDDVQVFFHSTNAADSFIPLTVLGVTPQPTSDRDNTGHFGYTHFLVNFDPGSHGTGTYSYVIKPNISDRIRSTVTGQLPQPTVTATASDIGAGLPIPTSGSGGTGLPKDKTTSTITLTGHPNQIITDISVTVNLTHTSDSDLIISLMTPTGVLIPLALNEGSGPSNQNFTNTTFNDFGSLPIFFGTAPYSDTAINPFTGNQVGAYQPEGSLLSALKGKAVDGAYSLVIQDTAPGNTGVLKNFSLSITSTAPSSQAQVGNKMDQNANAIPGEIPQDNYAVPLDPTNPNSTFTPDTLPLIVPGPHVVSFTSVTQGAKGTGDNLVLNNPVSSVDVTFDRDMLASSFTTDKIVQILGPVGAVGGPVRYNATSVGQAIPGPTTDPGGNSVSTATVTVPNDNGSFPFTHLAVQVGLSYPVNSDLTAILIAPNGKQVTLFQGGNVKGANFANTTFDDFSGTPISLGTAPYPGTYKPSDPNGLSQLNSVLPNGQPNPGPNAVGDLQGTWTLKVLDSSGASAGTITSFALIATPKLTITPNPNGTDPAPNNPRTFRIGFPQQTLSGTYIVQIASGVTDKAGEALDTNLNAGVDVLRGGGKSVATTPVQYNATNLPQPIPDARLVGTRAVPGELRSTINVPDSFLIQGITAQNLAGLTVQLDITHPNDPDLRATLISPDGIAVPLFANIGSGPNHANFTTTVLSDKAGKPITQAIAPFSNGPYNPQFPLLSPSPGSKGLQGHQAHGNWTLVIDDTVPGNIGKLNSWSLTFQKPLPSSGLGEPAADQFGASFRIFTMDPTNTQSSNTWTAVGPASIGASSGVSTHGGNGGRSGRIGGLAVDPSDPSGNTVFVGGASGGIWKTTNFLDPGGATYVPVSDFGPTLAINIGGIAVFGRNSDPTQSIVFAATGEGDTGNAGVGFIRSMDGGATWTLLDGKGNVDTLGNPLPNFVGTYAWKVVVDPHPTTDGNTIVYAALGGTNGGLWRSLDTGNHWTRLKAGTCTDVVLDPASGSNFNGNLQDVYAAFTNDGVYRSTNQGQNLFPMTGTAGGPNIEDSTRNFNPVQVTPGATPNGPSGRIELAKPALTGNAAQDLVYRGWLYAAVVDGASHFSGLYLTKDFGATWTKLHISTLPPVVTDGIAAPQAVPTNDETKPDYDLGGGPAGTGLPAQGIYDFSFAIDPQNPNITYMGGTADGQPTGFIRIDATTVNDSHSLVPVDNNNPDGGKLALAATGPLTVDDITKGLPQPFINLIRNPGDPFGGSPVVVSNSKLFNNTGGDVKWIPFDIGGTDQHRIITEVDPITGRTRIIIGDDQGVYTAVDNNGKFDPGIGTAVATSGSRNGNLQITQFYYGAGQPSLTAAVNAAFEFVASAQDNGGPASDPNVLTNGNIVWGGPGGDATGVATDPQGSGTLYQYWWPCCGGGPASFFQVNGIGQTNGLIQDSKPGPVPDPTNWPSTGGSNFNVNPFNGQQILISSQAGKIFETLNGALLWSQIGGKETGFDGSYAPAEAFGAPPLNTPSDGGFVYVGTSAGHIYVTQNASTIGSGTQWRDISSGLGGGGVQQIITNPHPGSHEAYAVTSFGVFHTADSLATPALGGTVWTPITSNLFALTRPSFNDPNLTTPILSNLKTIQADWRYTIPDDPNKPNGPAHPILYVGGQGGVFRSLDAGKTWTPFPNQALDASPQNGGYLPVAQINSLNTVIGNIDPTTGLAVQKPGDPNVLLASTYGRGSFAIRLAPIVFPNTLAFTPASLGGTKPGGVPIVTTATPTINGFSESSSNGNVVTINLYDSSDPNTIIGTGTTDAFGRFSVTVNPGSFQSNGDRTLLVQATDSSGTKGNIATVHFNLNASNLGLNHTPAAPTLALNPADDTSGGLNITSKQQPRFVGVTDPGVTVQLLFQNGQPVLLTNGQTFVTSGADGSYSLQPAYAFPPGTYHLRVQASNRFGSSKSPVLTFTVVTSGPTKAPTLNLFPTHSNDTGILGDGITASRQPVFTGTADKGATVRLYQVGNPTVLGQGTADPTTGVYTITPLGNFNNGTIELVVQPSNSANLVGPFSAHFLLTITTVLGDYDGTFSDAAPGTPGNPLAADPVVIQRTGTPTGAMQWHIRGVTPFGGVPFGNATLDTPIQGDFFGDGVTDLATYRSSTSTWSIQHPDFSGGRLIPFGAANLDLPVPADYDGDGTTDLAVFRPYAQAEWWIQQSTAGGEMIKFGTTGQAPVPGNYDNTGKDEIAIYDPRTYVPKTGPTVGPHWDILGPSGGRRILIGGPGLIPVPGAYDATASNHSTEPAVFNPANDTFTIHGPAGHPGLDANGNYSVAFKFPTGVSAQPGDIPVQRDYDNVGRTELAVYRPITGMFYIDGPNGVVESVQFGGPSFTPVASPYRFRTPPGTFHAGSVAVTSTASSTSTVAEAPATGSLNFGGKALAFSLASTSSTKTASPAVTSTPRPRPNVVAAQSASTPTSLIKNSSANDQALDVLYDGLVFGKPGSSPTA